MSEAEEIKQRKLEALKQNAMQQQQEQLAAAEAELQLNQIMKQILTEDARSRLNNVRLVNRELYFKAAQSLVYLYRGGQFAGKIDDLQLKKLLERLSEKKEISIKRK